MPSVAVFIVNYAECRYAECHYAECHTVECRYAECHGVKKSNGIKERKSLKHSQ